MPWSGGSFTRANGNNGWTNDANLGIGIEAGLHDAQDNDFKDGINQCLNKDGSNSATGNLNLGGYLPTNIGAGTAAAPAICAGNDVNTGIFSPAADTLAIATNGVEKIRIDTSGSASFSKTGSGSDLTSTKYENGAQGAIINLQKSKNTTIGINTIVAANDSLGEIYFNGANGTGFSSGASIVAQVDGTPGASNDMPGRLVFSTTPDTTGTPVERMRISSSGNVGVGNSNPGATRLSVIGSGTGTNMIFDCWNSTPQRAFYAREDLIIGMPAVYFNPSGSGANMVIDSAGILYRSTSSLKYKDNVENLPYGLNEVLQLRPVTFSMKKDDGTGRRFAGLIAEELDAIGLNEFVEYAPDSTPDALYYGNLVSLAFKAIQELNAKVEALEARIAALEA